MVSVFNIMICLAGSAGFEPVISSVTGRRDNPFTTSPYDG